MTALVDRPVDGQDEADKPLFQQTQEQAGATVFGMFFVATNDPALVRSPVLEMLAEYGGRSYGHDAAPAYKAAPTGTPA